MQTLTSRPSSSSRSGAEKYNGVVLSSETLSPGETKEIEVEIPGIQQVYIGTELKTNHDKARRIIIGEPTFLK